MPYDHSTCMHYDHRVYSGAMVKIHACTVMLGLIFDVIKTAKSGGRSLPQLSNGCLGGARPRNCQRTISQLFTISVYLRLFTTFDDGYDYEKLPLVCV